MFSLLLTEQRGQGHGANKWFRNKLKAHLDKSFSSMTKEGLVPDSSMSFF